MQGIQPKQAIQLVQEFIALLEENLKTPTKPEFEGEEVVNKERWTVPLITELEQIIENVCKEESIPLPIFDKAALKISYAPNYNHEQIEYQIEDLIKELSEDLEVHEGIRSSDDQYEDPQEWWLRPFVDSIYEAKLQIYLNTMY